MQLTVGPVGPRGQNFRGSGKWRLCVRPNDQQTFLLLGAVIWSFPLWLHGQLSLRRGLTLEKSTHYLSIYLQRIKKPKGWQMKRRGDRGGPLIENGRTRWTNKRRLDIKILIRGIIKSSNMKYWLFDVAGLSKLNVVSVTNPPLAISLIWFWS